MTTSPLAQLAQAAGLAIDWTDAYNQPQQVNPDTLRAILQSMELPCASDPQIADSLARLNADEHDARLPPLLTAQVGQPIELPRAAACHGQHYRIVLEHGGVLEGRCGDNTGQPLLLPAIDRPGYHALHIHDQQVTLAVAPARCYSVADALAQSGKSTSTHLWGLAVQLYSLWRAGDGGIGDFGALGILTRAAAEHGAAALAISPVHAMFSSDLYIYSPYSPSSRLFLNALHIDPAAVLGVDALMDALHDSDPATRLQLEKNHLIDWPNSSAWRLQLLRTLFDRFMALNDGAAQVDFNAFRDAGGMALENHARYEALHASFGAANGDWRNWAPAYRDPRSAAVTAFAQAHADQVAFHVFLQWQAARGLAAAQSSARAAGMPIGIVTDLAVGAAAGGSQSWSQQQQFLAGVSVGAPPDLLNTRGQNWGLGALSPHALRTHGFSAYLDMLRAAFRYAGGVRIDHVLGLARLWLVPHGAPATEGAYLRYPFDDLIRLIALESHRHRAIVIGEDLGTIPAGFDRKLIDAGLMGIRVLHFQRQGPAFIAPQSWQNSAIATTTTHDLPTVAGWWHERDIDWRAGLDLLAPGMTESDERHGRAADRHALLDALAAANCHAAEAPSDNPDLINQPAHRDATPPLAAIMEFVGQTPAPLVMLPIEDALGLSEQPNLPGTLHTHPNWQRRLPTEVSKLLTEPAVVARLAALNRARARTESTS